ANPNNPTGTLIPKKDVMELAETGIPLVIDEAYYEFSRETALPLVSQYPNLIVLRTFSKWAGLAGLRVGYGFFPPKIADYLLKIKPPYNINAAALVAVRESLNDADYLLSTVKKMIAERDRLFTLLSKISFLKPVPSRANFILCAVLKGEAVIVQRELEEKGILTRYYDTPLLRNYIRFSVGKSEHTDILIKALREIEERVNV
ncbi:MAG: aminotransferase class I/II-fold pyridoxal phosphate-dependent enzyme, partial [Dehalococcoidia bacterium]|nr:aminotransferase class I/II-fold pyridoxal phosphate-dependent enzyme [Dehalococcoidia bacterium]